MEELNENDIKILEILLRVAVIMHQKIIKDRIWDFTTVTDKIENAINNLKNEEIKEKLKVRLEELVNSTQAERTAVNSDIRNNSMTTMDNKTYNDVILKIGLLIQTLEEYLPKKKGLLERVLGFFGFG